MPLRQSPLNSALFRCMERTRWFRGCSIPVLTTQGNSENHQDGAFAEYIAADPHLAARIPDHLSFEEAAPLGLGIVTAAQYLYQALRLPLPRLDGSPGEREAKGGAPFNLLVYGGSTATGKLAIQLAKL